MLSQCGPYRQARKRGVNLLLDVPPNRHGLILDEHREALMRLKRNAKWQGLRQVRGFKNTAFIGRRHT